jgi:hypothetical protein
MKRFISCILFIGIALLPIYFSASGGVQASHAVLAIFSIFSILISLKTYQNWLFIFMALVVVVALREFFYIGSSGNFNYSLPILYWIFNFLFCLAIYFWIYSDQKNIIIIKYASLLSIIIALVGIFIFGFSLTTNDEGIRAIGTFNNPNQLGYFAVCMSSILLLFKLRSEISTIQYLFFNTVILFLAIVSLSKAAMISILFCIFIYFFRIKLTFWTILFIIFSMILFSYLLSTSDLLFINRLQSIGDDGDDSFSARGYFAFTKGSDYQFLWGLGEQGSNNILGHEVHSTIFNIFNNYGLVGFVLFFILLLSWVKRVYSTFGLFGVLGIVGPPMLYGITHNGTRFTLFWLLFSLSMCIHRKTFAGSDK